MTETTESNWYNEHYPDPEQMTLFPANVKESPYYEMYETALNFIPKENSVVELGCGDGRFAYLLLNRRTDNDYVGFDFSHVALDEAKAYNEGSVHCTFEYADLRTLRIPRANTYVTLEVLEHLEDDLALLERIPRNSFVVVSVPSFDSASHLRYFKSEGSALDRYGAVLDIDDWRKVRLPNKKEYFHVFRGTK